MVTSLPGRACTKSEVDTITTKCRFTSSNYNYKEISFVLYFYSPECQSMKNLLARKVARKMEEIDTRAIHAVLVDLSSPSTIK
jgi:hypothetical protein